MCIIVYKPAGIDFPGEATLRRCFAANPHGAGYMVATGGKVRIRKGLMTAQSLIDSLDHARETYGDYPPYVLHFRVSTQAGVRPDCCHPFPLSADMADLRKVKAETPVGIAHNGVIDVTSVDYRKTVTYSDTMRFITDFLSLIIVGPDWHKDGRAALLIERIAKSKLAILGADGVCKLIGGPWIVEAGCHYSNGSFRPKQAEQFSLFRPGAPASWEWEYADDDKEPEIWDYFDERVGMWDFRPEECCPYVWHDDTGYCEDCKSYGTCLGID